MVVAAKPTRPALRYFGSKWRIAPWVISHFPPHKIYVEPFAGGASILLRKDPSDVEIYNDLDGEVCNFFRVLRDQSDELIAKLQLTPYSRKELEDIRDKKLPAPADNVERARRIYVLSWQMFGGPCANWKSGWRRSIRDRGTSTIQDWNNIKHLKACAERLKMVALEVDPADRVIARYDRPDVLFYVDPPYVQKTVGRTSKQSYSQEMDDFGHRILASQLNSVKAMVIVSGFKSELYDELFKGWKRVEKITRTLRGEGLECLWLSPRTVAALKGTL